MSQSRRRSLAEALLNSVTGLIGQWAIAFIVLTLSPYSTAVTASIICVSWGLWGLVRGYTYRRLFNQGEMAKQVSHAEYLHRLDRVTRQRDSARRACGQASFALRTLLPDHPDARMTIELIDKALTPSTSTGEPSSWWHQQALSPADAPRNRRATDSDYHPPEQATTILVE